VHCASDLARRSAGDGEVLYQLPALVEDENVALHQHFFQTAKTPLNPSQLGRNSVLRDFPECFAIGCQSFLEPNRTTLGPAQRRAKPSS
jgi:hypothetical protein